MKSKHIVTFSDVATTGLGLFLIVGLSGCDSKSCTKGNATYTGDRVQECLNSGGFLSTGSATGSSVSSGYFGGYNSNNSSYHSGG